MSFKIEIKIQNIEARYNAEDITFSEAIETVFYRNNSMVIMYWNDILFELSIYSCISELYSQRHFIIKDLETMSGAYETSLLSDELTVRWHCTINGQSLTINTEWWSLPKNVDKSMLTPNKRTLVCNKTIFISEWRKTLDNLSDVLRHIGYEHLKHYE